MLEFWKDIEALPEMVYFSSAYMFPECPDENTQDTNADGKTNLYYYLACCK